MTELRDRVVVVTGAGRGMGRAYVRAFAAEGAKVVALNRSWDPARFPDADDRAYLAEIMGRDHVLLTVADITRDAQVEQAFDATMARFGTVDALVNNAGMRQRDLFPGGGRITTLETTNADFERMLAVNLFGTLNVTRRFIQPMLEQRRGSVVFITTTGVLLNPIDGAHVALRPNSREQPYVASKAAITNVMLYLADEVREHNVAVNVVGPSFTRTGPAAPRAPTGGGGGPRPLRPEHVVPLVSFLVGQDAQGGVTGKVFDAVAWNLANGLGGRDEWAAPD